MTDKGVLDEYFGNGAGLVSLLSSLFLLLHSLLGVCAGVLYFAPPKNALHTLYPQPRLVFAQTLSVLLLARRSTASL